MVTMIVFIVFDATQPRHSYEQHVQDGSWQPFQQECSQGLLQHTQEHLEGCSPF